MNAQQFCQWLKDMKSAKVAMTDKACGELLGVSTTSIVNMKSRGCDRRTALSCAALLKQLKPYGD